MQYIALIHRNTDTTPTSAEWDHFFEVAGETGMFKGGSAIGTRHTLGRKTVPDTTQDVGGFMRFDSEHLSQLNKLLESHPVIKHGGTIELCEMPES
jgi:hypothetical protein